MTRLSFSITLLGLALIGCTTDTSEETRTIEYVKLQGKTMGTTYSITHADIGRNIQGAVDSLLEQVNLSASTYIPQSTISQFNASGRLTTPDVHFAKNLEVAGRIYEISNGAFDPTVGPLVNAWGFGWEGRTPQGPGDEKIDSLLALVGFNKINTDRDHDALVLSASVPGMQLDFSALAKGYGVDAVCQLLEKNDIEHYFVEIGGEVRVSGNSPRGDYWVAGISMPQIYSSSNAFYARLALTDVSLATSGNYRNYYEIDGKRVWHTINPESGYPEENPILSASIIASRCIDADALATACMVMGGEKCISMINSIDAEAYILMNDDEGGIEVLMTPDFDKYLIEQ